MTLDTRSLAGIEGMLLDCSPGVLVAHDEVPPDHVGKTCTIGRLVGPWAGVVLEGCSTVVSVPVDAIALDLMQRTGRAHAAWFVDAWAEDRPDRLQDGDHDVLNAALCGRDLPPGGMERLRDLVLLAAGRGDAVASAPTSER